MPRAVYNNPVTYDNVTRPVAMEIVRELMRVLHLPSEVQLVFPGSVESVANPGSTLQSENSDVRFDSNSRIMMEVQERPVEDRLLTIESHEREHYPIFHDPNIGVTIAPVYVQTEMMISCTVRFKDRVSAQRFRDDCLFRIGMLRREDNHILSYHYSIPNPLIHLLRHIYDLRESVAGYGQTFNEWMQQYVDDRITVLSNMSGRKTLLAIPETQMRVWGTFSEITANTEGAEKDKETGTWTIRFDYRVQYDKPIACRGEWPLVVHNQFIDSRFYHDPETSGRLVNHHDMRERPSLTRRAMDVVAADENALCVSKFKPLVIPGMDDWAPAHTLPHTQHFLQMLIGANADDPHLVVDLRGVEDIEWSPGMLEFLQAESAWAALYGRSILFAALYRWDKMQDMETVRIDSSGVMRCTNPLNLRDVHHVRLHFMSDLHFLHPSARERLLASGEVGARILTHMQHMQFQKAYVPRVVDGRILYDDFRYIANLFGHYTDNREYPDAPDRVMQTVNSFHIITRRISDEHSQTQNAAGPAASSGDTDRQSRFVSRCDG